MTMPAAQTNRAGAEQAVERLEAALAGLLEANRTLLTLAGEHRNALARADLEALRRVISRQNQAVQQVAEHERSRLEAVAALAGPGPEMGAAAGKARRPAAGVRDEAPLRGLSAAIEKVTEPARSRLLTLGDRLRELLLALHREQAALRAAAESLSTHMQGLMRQVYGRLSHAGTYGRAGHVDTRVQVVTSLDVKQ
jgi:type VI protein secretion system component VasF